MTEKASNKMKALFEKSIAECEAVLDGKEITDITRMAAGSMSTYAKLRQTETHDKGIEFGREKFKAEQLRLR